MELCTTLMERWRLETNTFHMYHGEMTITLEDVSFITSLPVDGAVVACALERFPSIAQRTYDDRRRGPDGQDHPSLRRCSLEPNRNLF
ncbi:Protein MAINTENANCE OF MERISTEMS [Linum grandiflorum]